MKAVYFSAFALLMFSCNKQNPVLELSEDKAAVAPGDTLVLSFSVSDDHKFNSASVDVLLHYENNSSVAVIERVFSKEDENLIDATVNYCVPYAYLGDSLQLGDHLEIRLYAEDQYKKIFMKSSIVDIQP